MANTQNNENSAESEKKSIPTPKQTVTKQDIVDLKTLLSKNLYYTKLLYQFTKKVDKFLYWTKIRTIAKIVLILTPIILAYIFVVPMVEDLLQKYKNLLENFIL